MIYIKFAQKMLKFYNVFINGLSLLYLTFMRELLAEMQYNTHIYVLISLETLWYM